jgi:hypothetical protein
MIMKELIWNDLTKEMLEKAFEIEKYKLLAICFIAGFCAGFVFQKQAAVFLLAFMALVYLLYTTYSKVKQSLIQDERGSS